MYISVFVFSSTMKNKSTKIGHSFCVNGKDKLNLKYSSLRIKPKSWKNSLAILFTYTLVSTNTRHTVTTLLSHSYLFLFVPIFEYLTTLQNIFEGVYPVYQPFDYSV